MPRIYVRKKKTVYSEDELQARVALYKRALGTRNEISIATACDLDEERKIPVGTFWNRLHEVHQNRVGSGGMTILSQDEEEYLVFGLECMAEYGWGAGGDTLREIVKNFLELIGRENPFPNGVPGKDWLMGFRKRWKYRLSLRKPEYLTVARARGTTEESHMKFMQMVDELLSRLGIKDKPDHLYNCDEVGLNFDPKLKSVFAARGAKNVSVLVPTEGKEQVTVLVCGNAAGEFLPPFVVDCDGRNFFGVILIIFCFG